MESKDKQRKYSRLNHSFIAKVRICEQGDPLQAQGWDIVTIRNLSAGGLSFNYHKKIATNTVLHFKMGLSLSVGEINCRAAVCRVDESPPIGEGTLRRIQIHGIAVQFTEIDNMQQEAIDKLVQDFHGEVK